MSSERDKGPNDSHRGDMCDADRNTQDEDHKAILARRRAFVLSALAGVAISMEEACKSNPFVNNSPTEPDTGVVNIGGPPVACLSQMPLVPDAFATPRPCLSESPMVCLSRVVPRVCLRARSISPAPCLEVAPPKDGIFAEDPDEST